ncbi:uncharacterized protein BDR25DRAFT_84198 [Lindgomyces ingoldianus]|uniref:Uncharacterized protein n=1 Tax=Lindgomyces ingoldianus TaxID=673940 RepID=A0ACB6QEW7_9PLEO|nr:uncharacterized protein BDR25DRAFT_84198 [Lindgomyces ingoldianus]KAF2465466.1 hypothetical protein BDR25DRAFT_84198 [Lindgomyces ingoldianus]
MLSPASNAIFRLPEELRSEVLSYCSSSTVLNLCLASKALHAVFIDSIYHTIDLSTHNEGKWGIHYDYINVMLPDDHVKRTLTDRDVSVLLRQEKLISRLKKHPELGSKTRVLRWTLMDNTAFDGVLFVEPSHWTDVLWTTFKCFSHVIEIDLAFMTRYREQTEPPPLFRTATSISLAGLMSHDVVASILSFIDPSRLRHLKLNNLQTFADPPHILNTLQPEEIQLHQRDRPGAIQGYLSTLTGRCPTLCSLHISTTGQFLDTNISRTGPSVLGNQEFQDGNNQYIEIAAFLESVKGTLREFVFEHGPDFELFHISPTNPTWLPYSGLSLSDPLPMDVFFDSHILPVISSGPWPKLQQMFVRGVGQWKPIDPWQETSGLEEVAYLHRKIKEFHSRAEMIWNAVDRSKAEVVVEDEASRPFYRLRADTRRNMTGARD